MRASLGHLLLAVLCGERVTGRVGSAWAAGRRECGLWKGGFGIESLRPRCRSRLSARRDPQHRMTDVLYSMLLRATPSAANAAAWSIDTLMLLTGW
jgi:hypothetical protein